MRSTARGQVLRRFLRLAGLLTSGEYTIAELAVQLDCDRRTLFRDLRAMRQAGIIVSTHRDRTDLRYHVPPEALIDAIIELG